LKRTTRLEKVQFVDCFPTAAVGDQVGHPTIAARRADADARHRPALACHIEQCSHSEGAFKENDDAADEALEQRLQTETQTDASAPPANANMNGIFTETRLNSANPNTSAT
jgi:hypothetical protein